jgi:hypothetical protein
MSARSLHESYWTSFDLLARIVVDKNCRETPSIAEFSTKRRTGRWTLRNSVFLQFKTFEPQQALYEVRQFKPAR